MNLTYVPPSGDPQSLIAIVAEQPGKQEVRKGSPFMGPAGDNLNECLHSAGINRSDCYLTNVVKDFDRPIKDYIEVKPRGRFEIHPEGKQYIELLKAELSNCSANVIIAAGNIALAALCDRVGITSWRGSVIESTLLPGRKVIPILHPATYTWEKQLQNPSSYLNKYLILMDLIKAKKESQFPEIKRFDRNLRIKPSFTQVMIFLDRCEKMLSSGSIVDYDIELYNQELSCIGFAISPYESMCIPFIGPQGDWFNPEQELEIMLRIEKIMENPNYKKRGQYVIFDSHFLLRKYGIRTHNLEDTMVAQKILYPEFRVGLDFITSMWTDIPYYKQDGKIWLSGVGEWERGWEYNCLDTITTADSHLKQVKELEEAGNQETYQRQVRLIEPLTYMMERGIRGDIQGIEQAYNDHGIKIEELQKELNALANQELNANSPKQLINYFYIQKKLTPYTKDKRLTVNEDALKRIDRKGFKEASLILDIRRLRKRRGTYLTLEKFDSDGRMRCSYNPVGTKFSRISSSENIFGTGTNLQNWPHDLLSFLTSDEGYVYYGIDMSQFENRIVAYVGNITQMIRAFEEKEDLHRMTASLIFRKDPEDISDEPGSSPVGGPQWSERFCGKKANHGFNYGWSFKAFSLANEISEKDGKLIYDAYHSAYPGLRSGYWEYVKNCLRENRTLVNLFGRSVKFYGKWGEKLFNVAYSCIPQGTCGDLINERGIEYIYYNPQEFGPVELLTQVHDSIGLQIPLSVPLIEHAKMLIKIKDSLTQPLEWRGMRFEVPADLTIGFNLNKDQGVELKGDQFSGDPQVLSDAIHVAIEQIGVELG